MIIPTSTLTIHPARPEDAARIVQVIHQMGPGSELTEEYVLHYLSGTDRSILLARRGEQVVGLLSYSVRADLYHENAGLMSAFGQTADSMPMVLLGVAALSGSPWAGHTVRFLADFIQPIAGDANPTLALGVEYNLFQIFWGRGGYRVVNEFGNLSLGAGIRLGGWGVDYTYQPFDGLGISHRFTLSYALVPLGKPADATLATGATPTPAGK